jgi:hypothetical protein
MLIPNPGSGKFGVNVFSGRLQRVFLHGIVRIAEGLA